MKTGYQVSPALVARSPQVDSGNRNSLSVAIDLEGSAGFVDEAGVGEGSVSSGAGVIGAGVDDAIAAAGDEATDELGAE